MPDLGLQKLFDPLKDGFVETWAKKWKTFIERNNLLLNQVVRLCRMEDAIRKLVLHHPDITKEEIANAFEWWMDNYYKAYTPHIHLLSDIELKLNKVITASKRKVTLTMVDVLKDTQDTELDDIDKEELEYVATTVTWPINNTLAPAVMMTVKNTRLFWEGHWKLVDMYEVEKARRTMNSVYECNILGDSIKWMGAQMPLHTVRWWFAGVVYGHVQHWGDWNGNLLECIWHPGHKWFGKVMQTWFMGKEIQLARYWQGYCKANPKMANPVAAGGPNGA